MFMVDGLVFRAGIDALLQGHVSFLGMGSERRQFRLGVGVMKGLTLFALVYHATIVHFNY